MKLLQMWVSHENQQKVKIDKNKNIIKDKEDRLGE